MCCSVIILPEGLVDFLPDVSALLAELNEILAAHSGTVANINAHLTSESARLFNSLPPAIAQQLLMDRDAHGNVQVSKIESERLVQALVENELAKRKKNGTYTGQLSLGTQTINRTR